VRADDRQLAAIAPPAREEATDMPDQLIDAVMARSIQADVVRTHPLAAWVIARDQVDYSGQLPRPLPSEQGPLARELAEPYQEPLIDDSWQTVDNWSSSCRQAANSHRLTN
jgi:hypothetical protein